MKKFWAILWLLTVVLFFVGRAQAAEDGRLIVLCYHDIPQEVDLDKFAVDQDSFVNTIEYLRTHGFHFVSLQDVVDAKGGEKALPDKPILLTFDDSYATYYDFVFPLLKEYQIPSVLAVVSSWIDRPPADVKQKLMTWDQIRQVAKSPLVEIVSHSHALHQGVVYNPQGNEEGATVARGFDTNAKIYESPEDHKRRINQDILQSKRTLEAKLGVKVRAIAWPYGKYNDIALQAAHQAGIDINFSLNDKLALVDHSHVIQRFLVYKNPTLDYLLKFLKIKPDTYEQLRIMQVDLDTVYDTDPGQVEKNLGALLDRVKQMRVTTVYLQAFADPQGEGNVRQVYFPNKVLPMRMDLFNRVVHQLRSRCVVEVYGWLPVSSIILDDKDKTKQLRVQKYDRGKIVDSDEPYQRLSPFNKQAWEILYQLYADMASHSSIDGVIFQDDGYLTDKEDFSKDAQEEYLKITGGQLKSPENLNQAEALAWKDLRTGQIIALTEYLKKAVKLYRPEAKFARTIYPSVLLEPESEEWFAQNYAKILAAYDYTVVMAYPYLEQVKGNFHLWFKRLVEVAKATPGGLDKTVFKIQTFDWRKKKWLDTQMLNRWLRTLVAEGAHHVAYYPDDLVQDHPKEQIIRQMMSIEDYPYQRDYTR